jgi:hypothetical protein
MGILPSFFKQTQHKRFEYNPRYYDERKERIENLKQKYSENSISDYSPNIKGQFRAHYNQTRKSGISKSSKIRLIIAISISLLLLYYTLN